MLYCKNCGTALSDEQAVCLECGVKVGNGNRYCQRCGNPVYPEQDVCLSCGAELKKAPEKTFLDNKGLPEGKDRIVALLLCFFLGYLGIHSFYLGETKKGVVRLVLTFCCGIGAIVALIDFILLLIGSYRWNPDSAF